MNRPGTIRVWLFTELLLAEKWGRLEMSDLVPIEQKQVEFYGDEVTAVRLDDGRIVVPVRPMCEWLGVQWAAQSKRIKRDPVLSEESISVSVMDTQGQQRREMTCLPLDMLNGWLFGINADRVKQPEIRERVIRYQRECYRVLAQAFVTQTAVSPLQQVEQMGLAIATMAREQMQFDARLEGTETAVSAIGDRLELLEARIQPGRPVTEEQASQISQAVKAVALALGKQTKRNEFGACYGELYRKFQITSYKALPADKFEAALVFLTEWHQSLVGDSPF